MTLRQLMTPAVVVVALLAYLWIAAVPFALERPPAAAGAPGFWDLELYFAPKYEFGTRELLRGRLPLWNPLEFGGYPLLGAAQPAVLYPPKIAAYAVAEGAAAMGAFFGLHLLLGAVFFLAFIRGCGVGVVGATAGVLFWTFNARFLATLGTPTFLASAAWIPLIFLLAERVARSPSVPVLAALAISVALQITAGYPVMSMNMGVLLAVHAVVRYASGAWTRPPWHTIPLFGLAFLLGALIAGPQSLTLAELSQTSGREHFATASVEGLLPLIWSRALLQNPPDMLGMLGLLGLVLATGRRDAAPWLGALLCVFMVFGGFALLRVLPGFSAARFPTPWTYMLQFHLAWLVAAGAHALASSGSGGAGRLGRGLAAAATCTWSVAYLVTALHPESSKTIRALLDLATHERALLAGVLGAAGGIALVALALGFARGRGRVALGLGAVGLVAAAQLTAFPFEGTLRLASTDQPDRSSKLVEPTELERGRTLSLVDLRGGFHMLDEVESPFGWEPGLPPLRFMAMQSRLGMNAPRSRIRWERLLASPGLLETLDVHRILGPRSLRAQFERAGFRDTGRGERSALYEAVAPLGRAWGVYGVRVLESREGALDALLAPGFDPRRQVLLETQPAADYPVRGHYPPSPARVRRLSPTEVEVDVEMRAAGMLVLAEACFPGWTATVDGRPAAIACANALVRAVELGPGSHRVRFVYRPASVRWGLALSAATSVALLVLSFRAVRRR